MSSDRVAKVQESNSIENYISVAVGLFVSFDVASNFIWYGIHMEAILGLAITNNSTSLKSVA